ncbi:hypothetical protein IGI04_017579 [Brassica rapa subsp. trilocularis]|uniref:Uncharacterized protein n=1 Tax=Brassica rapa subsp. trilocularis TaxID=1813537 RepID=A0ABQ7MBK5_BRACM|nr:hypothetical protein IGI04_017579 [Brassica rapa subsp. trilocularis]
MFSLYGARDTYHGYRSKMMEQKEVVHAVSKKGNLVFYDNQKRLFMYYPWTNEIHCLSLDTCAIST